MPRYSKRDELLSRQRNLFGVDALEQQVADLTDLVFRLLDGNDAARVKDSVHHRRAGAWLLTYVDKQGSDYELGGNDGEAL